VTTGVTASTVKTLTVLFTDLVDSTGVRSRLGEDEAERLRQRHDRLVRAAVLGARGSVIKHTGDGVMATFEGAADAVSAAVAIEEEVDLDNRQGQRSEPLSIRIGISAGDVTVDATDCFGLPVIEAQRLESAARPGQILVSSVVRVLGKGRGGHEFSAIGALHLKGLDSPVEAEEVRWTPRALAGTDDQLPPALVDRGSFPFAGRTKESEILTGALGAVSIGATRLVLVAGEPGIGKTRLAGQAAAGVIEKGGLVLAGRCDEMVGSAYQPFAESLRHRLRRPGGADALGPAPEELARLVPELAEVVPGLPAPLSAEPEAERLRLFDAVRAWLAELSAQGPVLLVLDDLHWADAGTLLLLRHLVVTDAVPGMMVVATYRDTELDRTHPLSAMLGELRRRAEVTRIALGGLDAGEVTQLMTQTAGHDLAEDGMALAMAVQAETGGNPFFVGEVLRHLAESGAIVHTEGRWTAGAAADERLLPEGIKEVVGRRVNQLADGTQQALSTAAVIGSEFGLDVLAVVSGRDEDELIDALEPALAARLVTEAGVDRYRFAHALVRQTLHAELSTSRRARLHRSVASALEALHAEDLDAVATELAYHWGEAGPAAAQDQAVAYARRAGELAETRAAPEEAARWFAQARDLLDGTEPRLDAELAARVAQATVLGGLADSRVAVHEAARAAEALGDPALMAESLCLQRRTVLTEDSPEGADLEKIELLQRALALCPGEDRMLWARLSCALGSELLFTGDLGRRAELAQAVLDYASGLDDPRERFRLDGALIWARSWRTLNRSDIVRELSDSQYVAELSAAEGDLVTEIAARGRICSLQLWLGNAEHRDAAADYAALLERYPHPWYQDRLVSHRMVCASIDGRPADVEVQAAQLLRQMSAHGHSGEARVYSDSGMLQAAREKTGLTPFIEIAKMAPSFKDAKPNAIQAIAALALAEAGRHAEVRVLIDEHGGAGFADLPDEAALPVALCCWGEAASRAGHQRACAIFYDRLLPWCDLHPATGGWYLGAAARYLGLLCDALGHIQEADDWFAKAGAEHTRIQSPPWLARGLLDWAESHHRRGQHDQARALAAKALDAIGDLELNVTRSRAERILA